MAELETVKTINFIKNGQTVSMTLTKTTETVTGSAAYSTPIAIGTTAEALSFPGDLTTVGIKEIYFKNLDATNYVEIGGDSGLTVFKIKAPAGEVASFFPSSGNPTVYMKANSAEVNGILVAVPV